MFKKWLLFYSIKLFAINFVPFSLFPCKISQMWCTIRSIATATNNKKKSNLKKSENEQRSTFNKIFTN